MPKVTLICDLELFVPASVLSFFSLVFFLAILGKGFWKATSHLQVYDYIRWYDHNIIG